MADKNNKYALVYCFLDTNIFLEFQTFDEVEWPQLLHTKNVCLVLAPIVVYELDKHKSDYSNTRRQKRARMLLSKLTKLLEAKTSTNEFPVVRRNVTLMIRKEPLIDWHAEGLDPNIPDDRLIGSILDFRREHPSEEVCLLTDDSGPRFKAKSFNISTLAPPEELLHHLEPPSPEEVEIRALKKRLEELTDRQPDLKLRFYENEQMVDEITRLSNTLWQWRTPKDFAHEEIAAKRENLKQLLARADHTVPQSEVKEFTEAYEAYLIKLEPALKMQFIKKYAPNCRLEFMLLNGGTAPATDVVVYITFPKGSSLVPIQNPDEDVDISEELPREPATPAWAQPPLAKWLSSVATSINMPLLQSFSAFSGFQGSPLLYPGISISRKRPYDINNFPFGENVLAKKIPKLSHHRRNLIDTLVIYLPAEALQGFTASYTIMADELLEPIKGELRVRWEQRA